MLPVRVYGILILICLGLVTCVVSPVSATATDLQIEKISSNPASENNRGEYVVLSVNKTTSLDGWELHIENRVAQLPNTTISQPTAVSAEPTITDILTEYHAVRWDGFLPLSTDGFTIHLVDPSNTIVETVTVPALRTQEVYRPTDKQELSRQGQTTFDFDIHHIDTIQPFVLPDSPNIPRETIASAEKRIYMGGYELTDPAIVDSLLKRHEAGVDVRVILDGQPVGGQEQAEVSALDELTQAGIPVRTFAGERDRYRFHHPKYVVADDAVIVMTENWKPTGTGGYSSRGWGTLVHDQSLAADAASVFYRDFQWRDSISWDRERYRANPVESSEGGSRFPSEHRFSDTATGTVELVTTPEAGESRVKEILQNAEDEILLQQVSLTDLEFSLLQELIDAANRGVEVSILLDSSWYVEEENRVTQELLLEAVDDPHMIDIALVESSDRFEKIHTKGLVIDGETSVVGSMNWNNVSMQENREVMVVIESENVAQFFAEVFMDDKNPTAQETPVGLIALTMCIWIIAGLLARRKISIAT